MTYSLNTLNSSKVSASIPGGLARYASEISLVVGFGLLALWLIALLSHSMQDAAWSTSGSGLPVRNLVGRVGAWVADISYFLAGFSIWWCVAVAVRVWLSLLADRLRGEETRALVAIRGSGLRGRPVFWLGFALLMYASTTLEWSRLYTLELRLPGHSGGIVGYLTGTWSVKWFGFAGSGLVAIVLGVIGAAQVFGFSWMHLAERIGTRVDDMLISHREKRELAQDMKLGLRAAREREKIFDRRARRHRGVPLNTFGD